MESKLMLKKYLQIIIRYRIAHITKLTLKQTKDFYVGTVRINSCHVYTKRKGVNIDNCTGLVGYLEFGMPLYGPPMWQSVG